ncbi:MAG TPA: hemolysin III family protein [Dehalococcoidia bacterium]|jgi:hemolysin III|nr:hemolysin III family protein [Dehalococcoidia bacterium]
MTLDESRPLLRGYLHLGAAVAAVAGLVALVLLADSPKAYVGGAVFAVSLIALYTVSGVYHSIPWGPRMRGVLKRLDHAMIFVMIAGGYTPFCLFAGSPAWGISLLAVVWSVAAAGVVLKLAWPNAPRWLSVGLYLATGWIALVAATQLADWYAIGPLAVMALGGVLYSAGGIIYGLRRPNPFPRVFGYHEVFHALVIAGSVLHFAVVAAYLMPA